LDSPSAAEADTDAAAIAVAQPLAVASEAIDSASAMGQPLLADAASPASLSELSEEGSLGASRSHLSNLLNASPGDIRTASDSTSELTDADLQVSPPGNADDETNLKRVAYRRTVDRVPSSTAITTETAPSMARPERGKQVEGRGDLAASGSLRSDRRHPVSGDDSSAATSSNTAGTLSAKVDVATLIDIASLKTVGSSLPASSASNLPATQSSGTQTTIVDSVVPDHSTHAMNGESHAISQFREPGPTSARSEQAQRSTLDHFRLIQRVSKAFQHLGREGGEIRLRLAPPELGTLQLEMQIHDRSILARIQTDSETASAAIREHLTELRQRLESLGMRIEKLEVQSGLDDRGDEARQGTDAGQHAFRQPWRERESIASRVSEPSRSAETSLRVAQGVGTQGTPPAPFEGVDIRV
jgi:flagellar hook-length control protein FliK